MVEVREALYDMIEQGEFVPSAALPAGQSGEHPDLAAHTTLGLSAAHGHDYAATDHGDHGVAAHVAAGDPHVLYALDADLVNHEADTTSVHGIVNTANLVLTNDSRLSDARTPTAHKTSHATGGGDALAPSDIGAATSGHTHPGGSEAFPVGSVFIAVVSTNPATLLGYGTWAAFAAGRVLVGIDAGDADFDVAEETGGAKTKAVSAHAGAAVGNHAFTQPDDHSFTEILQHTHATDSQGAHVHDEYRNGATTGGLDGWGAGDTSTNNPTLTGYDTGSAGAHTHTAQNPAGSVASFTKSHAGGAVDAHNVTQPSDHSALNVVQPYITVHMWKRTA